MDLKLFSFITRCSAERVEIPRLAQVSENKIRDASMDDFTQRASISYRDCLTILAQMILGKVALRARGETFPVPDMATLLESQQSSSHEREKLVCILAYFRYVMEHPEVLEGGGSGITIERHSIKSVDLNSVEGGGRGKAAACHLYFHGRKIEDINNQDAVHVDFANRYIGGGVLCGGAVQEEIMFAQRPELIVSLAVCESMLPNEAIAIAGAREFCKTSGYYKSFRFESCCCNEINPIVAIDAPDCRKIGWSLGHSLTKAVAGFSSPLLRELGATSFSTGNWGCGVFANPHRKQILVQWLAMSIVNNINNNNGVDNAERRILSYAHFNNPTVLAFIEDEFAEWKRSAEPITIANLITLLKK